MINREQITSRKQDLEKDTEATQTLIQGLERQREQAIQRLDNQRNKFQLFH